MENKKLVTRENIINEAVYRCYKEMYANAQPSVDFDELLELAKAGKEDKNTPFYMHYYLSQKESEYIIEKYIDAYGLASNFYEHCDIILNYFDKGLIDKYIEKDNEPGYRGYEHLKPLKELIGEEAYNKAVERVNQAKNFYKFDREKNSFTFTISLGCSPTSSKDKVIEWWKSQGVDIEIKDRDEDEIFSRYYEGITEFDDED